MKLELRTYYPWHTIILDFWKDWCLRSFNPQWLIENMFWLSQWTWRALETALLANSTDVKTVKFWSTTKRDDLGACRIVI